MLDIEKLGVIASIAAVEFDGTGDLKTYYRIIDQTSALLLGLPLDEGTIEFWQKQDNQAIGPLLNSKSKVSLQEALVDFKKFVEGNTWLWAKGPDYDCVELASCYRACNLRIPWFYRNTRDVRTIMALAEVDPIEPKLKHDALSDAIAQAETVVACYKKLGLKI